MTEQNRQQMEPSSIIFQSQNQIYYEKYSISANQNHLNYNINSKQTQQNIQAEYLIQDQELQTNYLENIQSKNHKKQKKVLQICVNKNETNQYNQCDFYKSQLNKFNINKQKEVLINISDYAYLNGDQVLNRIKFPSSFQVSEAQLIIEQTRSRSNDLNLDHDGLHFRSRDIGKI
ncbi:hypothetical protein TTHERM_00675770 (macronuclear) [Tetrahymena thermophila SB210]|uniref:Uncharacterized protein n=1 Tax=Tetrahymena thermophila (strain SB210) TaxID=312017 RepID=Q23DY3_TETTS|nr:hypothetical protein TTHERM_00675770 [Tetrahymena thermophila SB210]EAR94804.1 hypothetical protein TTHERM_00675770 [Tetrahymena thermophila SB210]|eukprot:XP_001015049.1 hypothetical protein TTHERM_00675770 [Tetrahymena thermophila SB210]